MKWVILSLLLCLPITVIETETGRICTICCTGSVCEQTCIGGRK